MLGLFVFLACQNTSPLEQKQHPSVVESPKTEERQSGTHEHSLLQQEDDFSVEFAPAASPDPLFLSIDTSGVNRQIANSFVSEEMQASLLQPLDAILSGDVILRVSAPKELGKDKPVLALQLSPAQFLHIAPQKEGKVQTAGMLEVFKALNAYRNLGGNTADIRIFHFWIAIDVGGCRVYPAQQDAFVPITAVDNCVEEGGQKHCTDKLQNGLLSMPRVCLNSSP